MNGMIGIYDYTVVLTYLSLISGCVGTIIAMSGVGHPYIGMFLLLPVLKTAQVLLVGTSQVLAISLEEAPHALGRYRVGVQPFFLRSLQTRLSSRFLPQLMGGSQG